MSYPGKCPNGSLDDGAHDFRAEGGTRIVGMAPVIYCTRCGEIRPLEVPRIVAELPPYESLTGKPL